MDIPKQLEALSLPDREVKVLSYLLQRGSSLPSAIAKTLSVNRVTMYDILHNLQERGLVNRIVKEGKQMFQVVSPKQWLQYWEQQEEVIRGEKETLEKVLPDLEALYRASKKQPRVEFFEGMEGIQQAFLDSLDAISPEIVGYSSVSQVVASLPPKFIAYYTNQKIKRGIKSRFVLRHTEETPELIRRYLRRYYRKDVTGEFTPRYRTCTMGRHAMKNEIMIYDDIVVMANITPPHLMATMIQNKDIAEGQRAIFEIAWRASKPLF